MWILRWLLMAIFIIVVIGFAMQNTEQTAVIKVLNYQSVALPLWLIMYIAFAVGLMFWLLVSAFQLLNLKNELRKQKKDNNRLKKELDSLRNVAVEDSVIPDTSSSELTE